MGAEIANLASTWFSVLFPKNPEIIPKNPEEFVYSLCTLFFVKKASLLHEMCSESTDFAISSQFFCINFFSYFHNNRRLQFSVEIIKHVEILFASPFILSLSMKLKRLRKSKGVFPSVKFVIFFHFLGPPSWILSTWLTEFPLLMQNKSFFLFQPLFKSCTSPVFSYFLIHLFTVCLPIFKYSEIAFCDIFGPFGSL